jgi:hypothetical protein
MDGRNLREEDHLDRNRWRLDAGYGRKDCNHPLMYIICIYALTYTSPMQHIYMLIYILYT